MAIAKLDKPLTCRNGQVATEIENGAPVWHRNEKGEAVCGALRPHGKSPCPCRIRLGNGRCRIHGGKNQGAPLKHGGRSEILKRLNLGDAFERMVSDASISSNRANIATIEAFIEAQLEDGVNPTAKEWDECAHLHDQALTGDVAALRELGDKLREGLENARSFERLLDLLDQQRRHKASEERREKNVSDTITARQANALILAVFQAVKDEVGNLDTIRRVGSRFARIIGSATHLDDGAGAGGA